MQTKQIEPPVSNVADFEDYSEDLQIARRFLSYRLHIDKFHTARFDEDQQIFVLVAHYNLGNEDIGELRLNITKSQLKGIANYQRWINTMAG